MVLSGFSGLSVPPGALLRGLEGPAGEAHSQDFGILLSHPPGARAVGSRNGFGHVESFSEMSSQVLNVLISCKKNKSGLTLNK